MSERKVKSRSRLFSFSFRSMCQYLEREATIRHRRVGSGGSVEEKVQAEIDQWKSLMMHFVETTCGRC